MGLMSNKHMVAYKGALYLAYKATLYLSVKLCASWTTILIWLNAPFSVPSQLIWKLSPLVFILLISYGGNPIKEIPSLTMIKLEYNSLRVHYFNLNEITLMLSLKHTVNKFKSNSALFRLHFGYRIACVANI